MEYMAATKEPTLIDVSEMGRRGGKARAEGMTKEQRSESARKAVQVRWANAKKKTKKKKGENTHA